MAWGGTPQVFWLVSRHLSIFASLATATLNRAGLLARRFTRARGLDLTEALLDLAPDCRKGQADLLGLGHALRRATAEPPRAGRSAKAAAGRRSTAKARAGACAEASGPSRCSSWGGGRRKRGILPLRCRLGLARRRRKGGILT